jgi:inhibitor of KinA
VAAQPHVGPGARPRLLDAGDAAFTIEFGDRVDAALLAAVNALDAAIGQAQAAGQLPGLIETMPTFRSLTVFYDPLQTRRAKLLAALQPMLDTAAQAATIAGRPWVLPVCYEPEAGPDLAATAQAIGASVDELIALHSGTAWRVYMLGFLPGFPFLGDAPARLQLPRRTEPRVRVPAGSVAVAGGLSAIYPWESPGGWHLLGRCPVPLFDARRDPPALLAAGDSVRFQPVSMAEYRRLDTALQAGEIDPGRWQAAAATAADPERLP